jgi:microcystin-dependent protein
MYINVSPPTDYLICNGASLSRTTYSTLFALIGTSYGTASLTTFNLPDFRGLVPRGFNDTAADLFEDPDRASRVARYTGGATGNTLGSY